MQGMIQQLSKGPTTKASQKRKSAKRKEDVEYLINHCLKSKKKR